MRRARLLKSLYVQVLLAMMLGMGIGHVWPAAGAMLKPPSDAFVALVKLTIA
ncbi:dicarboxylate/amino acid:cation symporter, partial [Burkholderia cenocepacia]|nr:dicarboxylate/amino acid:cation symporter [Burkholderia cenocepacia]